MTTGCADVRRLSVVRLQTLGRRSWAKLFLLYLARFRLAIGSSWLARLVLIRIGSAPWFVARGSLVPVAFGSFLVSLGSAFLPSSPMAHVAWTSADLSCCGGPLATDRACCRRPPTQGCCYRPQLTKARVKIPIVFFLPPRPPSSLPKEHPPLECHVLSTQSWGSWGFSVGAYRLSSRTTPRIAVEHLVFLVVSALGHPGWETLRASCW